MGTSKVSAKSSARERTVSRFAPLAVALIAVVLVSAGCGGGSSSGSANPPETIGNRSGKQPSLADLSGGCADVAASTLGSVGKRIYAESSHGADVGEAVARVRSSTTLAAAISSGDAGATRAALTGLLANQIVRIEILEHGNVLASAGSGAAIAPVQGSIPGTAASFVLSTQAAGSYVDVTRQVTGAEVVLYGASGRLAGSISGPSAASVRDGRSLVSGGHSYQVSSIAGSRYPSGTLRIALLVPRSVIRCPPSEHASTATDTLGQVGERIYREEADSPYVRSILRRVEADKPFQQAVAARDTTAIRTAIVSFFAAHIHVVRVRVYAAEPSGAQRFLYDLGGPYVLAPVDGVVRSAGRIVARFKMAIQDDAGYMKLAQRFTGADVLMRVGPHAERQVMGTLDPGPARPPDRGSVDYRGQRYRVYSFTAEAFPSGPLRISLLWPAAEG